MARTHAFAVGSGNIVNNSFGVAIGANNIVSSPYTIVMGVSAEAPFRGYGAKGSVLQLRQELRFRSWHSRTSHGERRGRRHPVPPNGNTFLIDNNQNVCMGVGGNINFDPSQVTIDPAPSGGIWWHPCLRCFRRYTLPQCMPVTNAPATKFRWLGRGRGQVQHLTRQ